MDKRKALSTVAFAAFVCFLITNSISTFEPMPAGTRPDQLANLILWVKADSLGKTYAGDAQVDSVRDWANSGEWFTQATAGNRPLYRTGVSPTGLPGVDFDGSDDNLVNASSTTTYITMHNGDNTVFIVFLLDAANEVQVHWHNNGGSSANTGSFYDLDAEGNFSTIISHGVGGAPTYSFSTTAEFDQLDSVYYAVVRMKILPADTLFVRMNGVSHGFQTLQFSPYGGNATNDAALGHATAALNGKLLEMFAYSDEKTATQISNLELYIVDKWIAAQATASTRGRVIVIQQ